MNINLFISSQEKSHNTVRAQIGSDRTKDGLEGAITSLLIETIRQANNIDTSES